MSDLWIPGIPIDPGVWHGEMVCRPEVTCHRTYGGWAGDYATIKNNGLAHLLVGKEEGQWVQFAPANIRQWHDSQNVGYGIEITGVNEDDFTAWQIRCMQYVVPQLHNMICVPVHYDDGSIEGWVDVNTWNGFHSHNCIIPSSGTQHTNLWKMSDWDKIVAGASAPGVDWAAIAAAGRKRIQEAQDTMGYLLKHADRPQVYFVVGGRALKVPSVAAIMTLINEGKVLPVPKGAPVAPGGSWNDWVGLRGDDYLAMFGAVA